MKRKTSRGENNDNGLAEAFQLFETGIEVNDAVGRLAEKRLAREKTLGEQKEKVTEFIGRITFSVRESYYEFFDWGWWKEVFAEFEDNFHISHGVRKVYDDEYYNPSPDTPYDYENDFPSPEELEDDWPD